MGALSSLAETSAAVWHDALKLDKISNSFYLFEDRATSWVDAFEAELKRDRPFSITPPPAVLGHLRASRPEQVQDRAWLVMYYGIMLNLVAATDPKDEPTKAKLRCNLWLALNDARLLLEPSELNIQALILLALDVEEFTNPSLCWMLVTNACRMLQALGVNHRRFDPQTRDRRVVMFWHLNLVDIGLALIFGRTPTFHRGMAREMPLPTLNQLLSFQPKIDSSGAPALFGVHYIHQMFLLSRIMADIWYCLHEESMPNDQSIESTSEDLESWYLQAQRILEAAALAEKPFLSANDAASFDLALSSVSFQYEYLYILLTRSSTQKRAECIESSKRMLHLLENMVSDSEAPSNGMVWHLLCGPFTPFLDLFGELLSSAEDGSEGKMGALEAMEHLPVFLDRMSSRNSLAAKLKSVAMVLVQHARSVVQSQVRPADTLPGPTLAETLPDQWPAPTNMLDWELFFNHTIAPPVPGHPPPENYDAEPSDLTAWTSDFFDNGFADWVGWDAQV
ncbi:Fungal specific transcription factor domain-containing protein isoform 1 [Cladophialophora immunda]|nr:Fungal specific transcription factor domain-containing protein isoform 1 [Cladophialophora immunda]